MASDSARETRSGTALGHRHELLFQLRERAIELLALLERLAVPALLGLDKRHALALIVRARIIVGCPLVLRAWSRASRIAATSWRR